MTDTDVIRRLPAQPSTTDLNLWLVSRLKVEGSELTFGQIASIAKDLSAALRTPHGLPGGVDEEVRKALQFYADAWNCKPNKRYGGLEWSPKEELLDDCGNKAKQALSRLTASREDGKNG